MKNEITQNQQLAEELCKPIIRKFNKRKFIHHLKRIVGGEGGDWFSWYTINKYI